MPLSRKKSCASCRHSKSRCNQATPNCSRCLERGMRCVYDWKIGNGAHYARSPASRASRASHTPSRMFEEPQGNVPRFNNLSDISDIPASVLSNAFFQTGEVAPESLQLDWTAIDAAAQQSFSTPKLGPSLDMPDWIGVEDPEAENMGMAAVTQNIVSPSLLGQVMAASDSESIPSPPLLTSFQLVPPRRVFQKRRVLRHSALSSVALGQLKSFPKMMIQGDRLPPFITPPCHLHEKLAFDCAKSRRHRCLPKELAVCASLVEMFYSRTAQNADFVWQTIYAEKERLRQEHENFDVYQQLAALQALTIYILLQAQDVDTAEANGAHSLLSAVIEVSRSVTRRNKLDTETDTDTDTLHETPSRKQWIHGESARRTMILLIIVDIMMDCLLEPAAYQSCSYNLHTIPLPATRDLWEAQSNFIWVNEYERHLSRRKTMKTLNIGDLLELDEIGALKNLSRSDRKIDIVPDILNWCEGLDSLGSLLWMVMPFQQWRTQADISEVW